MDVSHELGALRFVVDSPLSSKVAMFNQQVDQHKQSQLLNPFANTDGRSSPKPTFSKDQYGKPLAGSLTEMRGQKANIHVLKEMLELCQIIDSEGYNVKDEPSMRVIPFGELFNIYNYISDKVVGILLRARKHKLVEFEGEMLFQRRDDDVPIFLIKPVHEIRREMEDKIDSIKRCGSPAPQATSVLMDRNAQGLNVPMGATPRSSVSRTPSPQSSKSGTPVRETKAKSTKAQAGSVISKAENNNKDTKTEVLAKNSSNKISKPTAEATMSIPNEALAEKIAQPKEVKEQSEPNRVEVVSSEQQSNTADTTATASASATATTTTTAVTTPVNSDVNNNSNNINNDLPTIVIEATAIYEQPSKTKKTSDADNAASTTVTVTPVTSDASNVSVQPPTSA